jgi:hypothetical protein
LSLADRLPQLDREQLLNLQANARRLEAEAGARGENAAALLPLIQAELAARVKPAPPKAPRAKKAKVAPPPEG